MQGCIILGSGPSLTKEDVKKAENSHMPIIGINNAYQICKCISLLYACDTKWWRVHYERVPRNVLKFSLKADENDVGVAGVTQLENDGTYGISHSWPRLKTGQNSGYQAINLAYLMGFKKIILLGYDMKIVDGKIHWHEPHNGMNPDEHRLKIWKENYNQLAIELVAASVTVLNATRETALDCFKKVNLEQIL